MVNIHIKSFAKDTILLSQEDEAAKLLKIVR